MTDITLRDALGDDLWKLQLAKLSRYECSLGKDETLSDLVSARYQDVDHTTDVETATLVTHDALSYSDYSGGTVERSNVRVLRESGDAANTGGGAEEERSVYLIAHGFHDTTALYFKLDEPMPEEHARSIASAQLALTDYPCADEGDLSELEHETGEEAWESYGRQDFMNDLQARVDRMEDCLTVDDCDAIDRAFPALANATNACGGPGYEFEQGGGVRFDNDRVLSAPVLAFAALGLPTLAEHDLATSERQHRKTKALTLIAKGVDNLETDVLVPIDRRTHIGNVNHRQHFLCHGFPPLASGRTTKAFSSLLDRLGKRCIPYRNIGKVLSL
jgi:hypothetical protein